MLKLLIPLVIEQFLSSIVGIADSMMVSGVGEAAVSGVSLVDNVNMLIYAVFAALATGGSVIIGQYLGRGDREKSFKSVEQLYWIIILLSVSITVLFYILRDFILKVVFGRIEADVYASANTYLLIGSLSIPFLAVYNSGAAIFRIMGNSGISMLTSAGMNVINIALNAVFIFGCRMGVAGASIATVISRVAAAAFITVLLRNQHLTVHFPEKLSLRIDFSYVKRILYIGIPSGVENGLFQFGKLCILNLITTFGTSAITANAVAGTISTFQILPTSAVGLSLLTIVSRCVGKRDYEQAKYYTGKLLGLSWVFMLFYNGLIALLLPSVLRLYHLSGETFTSAYHLLLLHGSMAILIWNLSFTLPNTLRAAGDVKFTMLISIISMIALRVALAYLIGGYFGLGVFGVWVAMMIDWVVRSVFFLARYLGGKWQDKKVI